MAGRLKRGRSQYDLRIDTSNSLPIGLMLDRERKNFKIDVTYIPTIAGGASGIQMQSWIWKPGKAGAGYSVETPGSAVGGGSDFGEFVWLRRPGVAQSAGKLTEMTLPAVIAATTTGSIFAGLEWTGEDITLLSNQTMIFSTGTRYMIGVDQGVGTPLNSADLTADFGAAAKTRGIAMFDGVGETRIYVGCTTDGLGIFDGFVWTRGGAGTIFGDLTTVYWTIGSLLATGGAAGTAGTPDFRMIGIDQLGIGFQHVAGDPATGANWSSLTPVGNRGAPIHRIASNNHTAWFGKGSGPHAVNELGYSPNLAKGLELLYSPNNCTAFTFWSGLLFFATEQGLMMFAPDGQRRDVLTLVQFGLPQSHDGPIYGRPRTVAPCERGVYVGYYNGTDSYIGLLILDEETPRWSMAECVIRSQEVTFIQQASPDGDPRLWIGTKDATGHIHLYWQSLPKSGDPEVDSQNSGPMRFPETWNLTLSRWTGQTPVPNTYRDFQVEADHLGDANTLEVYLAQDGGEFVLEGTATASPRWSADPTSGSVNAVSAQLKLIARQTETSPVLVRSVAVHYTPHPELTRVVTYPVIFGEGVKMHGGKPDPDDPGVKLLRLEQCQRTGVLGIEDIFGRTVEGVVEPGLDEDIVEESDGKGFTVHANVTISTTAGAARFDEATWDESAFS